MGVPAGFALLTDLEISGAVTPTALNLREPLTRESAEALAAMLGSVKRTCSWLIGDLLNHVEQVFADDYTYIHVAELTGLAPDTLISYKSICKSIPRSRRRADLSFGHHRAVAKLEPHDQNAYLKAAADNGWSRAELADEIRAAFQPPEQPGWSAEWRDRPAPATPAWEPPRRPQTPRYGTAEVLPPPTRQSVQDAARALLAAAYERPDNPHYWMVPTEEIQALRVALDGT